MYVCNFPQGKFPQEEVLRGTSGHVSDGKCFYGCNVLAGCKQVLLRKKNPAHTIFVSVLL